MSTVSNPSVVTAQAPGLLSAALVLAGRVVLGWKNQKAAVMTTWLFPVFVTLLFLGLFGGAIQIPDGARYSDFLVPGMLTVTMLFGLETSTLSAAADASKGINDRFRTFPINAAAIVLGRCLADMLNSVIGLVIMVGFGLLIGWRPETTPAAAATGLALLLLLRFAFLWLGIYVGYRAKSVDSVALVQVLVWPVAFCSSVFVDPTSMPTWLGALAELNPVSATATTVRDLLGTASWAGQILPGWTAPVLTVLWPVALTAVFLPLAARSFRSR